MLDKLKDTVLHANLQLPKYKIVIFTWGNVSAITADRKYIAIKPSGVPYDTMTNQDIVITDLEGNIQEGKYKPSTDLFTHLEIYKAFPKVNSIVHTHSINAVAFAQAKKAIPVLGTTHADDFYGEIPCTRTLTRKEVEEAYEINTGKVIVETFINKDYLAVPGVLVATHGPFTWGKNTSEAVQKAVILETVAEMALKTKIIDQTVQPTEQYILDQHYNRKHGEKAYYGQK